MQNFKIHQIQTKITIHLDSKQLSDEQIQAEAILNSLKNQEKINQKQKLLKVKSRKLEKDW